MMKEGAGSMEGEFWNGNLVRGKVVTPQGDVFEGYFQDSSLSQGIKRFKNGIIMRGRFKSNILVNGMISYPNGEQYSVRLGSQKKMIQIPRELLPQRVPPPDAPSR